MSKIGTKLKKGQILTAAKKTGTKAKKGVRSAAKAVNKNKKAIGAVAVGVAAAYGAYKAAKTGSKPKPKPSTTSQTMGYKCIKPYNRSTATTRDRVKSCSSSKVSGGTYSTRQPCIEKCYIV